MFVIWTLFDQNDYCEHAATNRVKIFWINISELCDKLQIKTWIIVTTADWFFHQNYILQVNQWGLALVMNIKEGGIGREG